MQAVKQKWQSSLYDNELPSQLIAESPDKL